MIGVRGEGKKERANASVPFSPFFLFFVASREFDEVAIHGQFTRAECCRSATRAHGTVALYDVGQTFSCDQFR